MRALLLITCFVVASVAPRLAHASSPFAVVDRGDRIEVIARGWTVVDPSAVTVNRERLELVVAGGATAARQSYEDRTVRRIEVRGREPRMLSIKLRADHARVVALAALTTVTQVGDELHVVIPRAVPAAPAPAPATAVEERAPADASPPPAAAPAVVAAPTPASIATPTSTEPLPAVTVTPPPRPRPRATTSSRWWMVLLGLGLVGAGATWFARTRARTPSPMDRLEIIDSRPLGGRARVVWLGAGDRELVVAVSSQQVRLLGQWRRVRNAAPGSEPSEFDDLPRASLTRSTAPRAKTAPATPASAAVSGILRLRDRPAPLADDVASGDLDEDEQWARDILAATGGRR